MQFSTRFDTERNTLTRKRSAQRRQRKGIGLLIGVKMNFVLVYLCVPFSFLILERPRAHSGVVAGREDSVCVDKRARRHAERVRALDLNALRLFRHVPNDHSAVQCAGHNAVVVCACAPRVSKWRTKRTRPKTQSRHRSEKPSLARISSKHCRLAGVPPALHIKVKI